MRANLVKLNSERDQVVADMEALNKLAGDEDREFTDAEQVKWDELTAKLDSTDRKIQREQALLNAQTRNTVKDVNSIAVDSDEFKAGVESIKTPQLEIPEPRGNLVAFKGVYKGKAAEERAYRFGRWMMGIGGHAGSRRFCKDHGLPLNWVKQDNNIAIGADYNEGTNSQGGYAVLPEFDRDIIRLVLEYGVFRRNCRVVPMGSDQKDRLRRTGGLTAYFVGEGSAGTKSTGSWDLISLIAKKLMVLSVVTNELNADAIIDMADNLAYEIALAFAYKEDYCGFYGDGTSTYGGITGLCQKLVDLNGVVDGGGGQIVAAGNLMTEVTLANLNSVVGRLPTFAEPSAKWYCHKFFKSTVMDALAMAAGGNTYEVIAGGGRMDMSVGYPVEKSELFPKADANSQILAVLADLRQCADLGDRSQMTIAMSESATVDSVNVFETDQFAVRATERFDINVHDVGTASAAGPAVALVSAAS